MEIKYINYIISKTTNKTEFRQRMISYHNIGLTFSSFIKSDSFLSFSNNY